MIIKFNIYTLEGDNSNNVVSGDSDSIVLEPTLIFNSINIINSNYETIDKNSMSYTFSVEKGNILTGVEINDDSGAQKVISSDDIEIIDESETTITYSLIVSDLPEGDEYNFDLIFYNSYFNLNIVNSGDQILIKYKVLPFAIYIWIIIALGGLLVLITMLLVLNIVKKQKRKKLE